MAERFFFASHVIVWPLAIFWALSWLVTWSSARDYENNKGAQLKDKLHGVRTVFNYKTPLWAMIGGVVWLFVTWNTWTFDGVF